MFKPCLIFYGSTADDSFGAMQLLYPFSLRL